MFKAPPDEYISPLPFNLIRVNKIYYKHVINFQRLLFEIFNFTDFYEPSKSKYSVSTNLLPCSVKISYYSNNCRT